MDYVKVSTALKSWKNTKGEPRSKHSRVTPGSYSASIWEADRLAHEKTFLRQVLKDE